MLKGKKVELDGSVPTLNNVADIKNNTVKDNKNKNINRNKHLVYIKLPIVLLTISIILTIILLLVNNPKGYESSETLPDNPSSPDSTEFYERQEELSKFYLNDNKNYLSNYIQSLDTDDLDIYESEHTKDLLAENQKQENETVVENIYYEVEIDYSDGSVPNKIVVKKNELVYPKVIKRSGYYFLGWFVDEVRLTQAIRITNDTKIVAKWGYKESVTIAGNRYDYYKDIDGVVIIDAIVADTEELIIPSQLNGLDVIGLATESFNGYNSNNHNITKKIVIPDTVKEIQGLALSNYNLLEEIYLPSQLDALYPSALNGCPKLKHIYISNNPRYKVINEALIDEKSKAYEKHFIKYLASKEAVEEKRTEKPSPINDLKKYFSYHLCPDQYVGKIADFKNENEDVKEDFPVRVNIFAGQTADVCIKFSSYEKIMILILESPHQDEFDKKGNPIKAGTPGDDGFVTWVDTAKLYYEKDDKNGLKKYMLDICKYYLSLGFDGFRCDVANLVDPEVWDYIISEVRKIKPDAIFIGESFMCPPETMIRMGKSGFDYIFSSSKWWNYEGDWLLEQYNQTKDYIDSISFPDNHDTDRLIKTCNYDYELFLQRIKFTALFSKGFYITDGLEFACENKFMVDTTRAKDLEKTQYNFMDNIKEILDDANTVSLFSSNKLII